MPEEVNRVICDALADLLLAPSETAAANLEREGVHGEVVITGDVMGDVVLELGDALDGAAAASKFGVTAGRVPVRHRAPRGQRRRSRRI